MTWLDLLQSLKTLTEKKADPTRKFWKFCQQTALDSGWHSSLGLSLPAYPADAERAEPPANSLK